MKMIIRADDVGFTKVHNMGTFETLDNGITTSVDVMLDTPGTEDALRRLKDYPWISMGWHTHFWGAPVLDPSKVPTMYDASIGHFRRDLAQAEDVSFDECVAEMRAQMNRSMDILGRVPDVTIGFGGTTPFARAMAQIIEEYGIKHDFVYSKDWAKLFTVGDERFSVLPAEEYIDKKIYMTLNRWGCPSQKVFNTDSVKEVRSYDPLRIWTEDDGGLSEVPEDGTAVVVLHPGYVDYYVAREGSQTPRAWNYLSTRALEAHALCSQELKDWIREHKIELVNFRDALYGTHEYQNHLRAIGSDLYMR